MTSAPESIDKYLVTYLVEQVEANRALIAVLKEASAAEKADYSGLNDLYTRTKTERDSYRDDLADCGAYIRGMTERTSLIESNFDRLSVLYKADALAYKLRLADKDSCLESLKAANAELVDGLEDAYEAGVSDGKAEVYEGLLRLLEGAYKASDT